MGLQEAICTVPVSELPLRELAAVPAAATVRQAVAEMRGKRVGCAIVVDQMGKPIGEFTERLLTHLLLEEPNALDQPVARHMVQVWGRVTLATPIVRVIQLMQRHDLRFVCVVGETGRAVALTGQRGVMEHIASHYPRQVWASRTDCRPYFETREGA